MLSAFVEEKKIWSFHYENKWKSEIVITDYNDDKIVFCKPQTFMNASGQAVKGLKQFYKIESENLLVLHDELEFPFAKIWTKRWWSAAWHNGLRSIIQYLWDDQFPRIRIGIWKSDKMDVADYVLQNFSVAEEKKIVEELQERVCSLIDDFLHGTLQFPPVTPSWKKNKR